MASLVSQFVLSLLGISVINARTSICFPIWNGRWKGQKRWKVLTVYLASLSHLRAVPCWAFRALLKPVCICMNEGWLIKFPGLGGEWWTSVEPQQAAVESIDVAARRRRRRARSQGNPLHCCAEATWSSRPRHQLGWPSQRAPGRSRHLRPGKTFMNYPCPPPRFL
jgi:hypothetical protein